MQVEAAPVLRMRRLPAVALVGTYPPTRCGIATFNAALRTALATPRCGVVACVDGPGDEDFGPEVEAEVVRGSRHSRELAARAIDAFDVAIVQHEFGIYGGPDGVEVLDLVDRVHVPYVAVLHTVLRAPTVRQRAIVERLAAEAAAVVVQSEAARARLLEAHDLSPRKVRVIPHGAPPNLFAAAPPDPGRQPLLLTWGLLGPGKGIELVLDALRLLRDLEPPPRYVVHGRTHPRVAEREGDAYRDLLRRRARELGVDDLVEFDDRYLDTAAVLAFVREADVVVLPYRSRDQVVSGVLVEAIASGKPVVATAFPHAVELLGEGSGLLVPHDDVEALAAALRRLLTDPAHAVEARAAAYRQAPELFWDAVGRAYRSLACALAPVPAVAIA